MKTVKRIVAVLLAVVLMAPAAVNAAAPSVTKTSINNKKANATVTFNAKKQSPKTVTINGKKLVVGKDCVIVGKKYKNAGQYVLTVKGIGNYSGKTDVVFTIKKAKQTIKTSVDQKSYKASALKKANKKLALKPKAIRKQFTYTVKGKDAKKYISVNKNGKVTVKKGIKKGTYKVVIKAKATKNHKAGKKVVRIIIK